MKITSIETYRHDASVALVRLTTEDGAVGWGQVSPFNADITEMVMHRQVAPVCLGRDETEIDELDALVLEETYKFPGSYVCRALTGIDTALWDLRGKRAGKSVCELLGGTPRPFKVYGSSMRRDITPEEEATRLRTLRDTQGYGAFKIRVGKKTGRDHDEWPGRTEALVPAVREAVGDDVVLLADGNSCFSPPRAIEVGRLLEEHGFGHFEEPCPYWELEWTAEVAQALTIPVAGGEQDHDLQQWKRIVGMRCVDIVQPDICYVGGLTRALRVAALAADAGLPCVPHSANHTLVTVFSLHMMGAIANAGPHVEFSIEPQWVTGMYAPVLRVIDGKVAIPSEPGWGVTISADWLANAKRQVSAL